MVSPDVAEYGLAPWPLMIVPIPFMIAATVALSLRLWVRCNMTSSFGLDDGFLIAAFVGLLAESLTLIVVGHIELYQGIIGPALLLGKLNFAGIAGYIICQMCFKISLAIFFLRILIQRWQRWMVVITVTVFIIYTIALFFVTLFECGDPGSPDLATATCIDWDTILGPINYVGAALNAVVDWVFALAPILVIRTLRMSKPSKISVLALILLAVSGSIVSILRIPYVDGLNPSGNYYSNASNRIAYTSIAEGSLGIVAVSLATLKPMFRQWLQTRNSSGRSSDKRMKDDLAGTWAAARKLTSLKTPRRFSLMMDDIELNGDESIESGNKALHRQRDSQSSRWPSFGNGNERTRGVTTTVITASK